MKPWYRSKTLIVNAVAILGIIINSQFGVDLDAETQATLATSLLAIVNIILRIITNQGIGR